MDILDTGVVDTGQMDIGKEAHKTVEVIHRSDWPMKRKKLKRRKDIKEEI